MNIYDKDILFKGFVVTQDKKCLETFKNRTDFKSFDQVKGLPEFAGILADGIVLIDVDDYEESEQLLQIIQGEKINCVVMKTTRGKHFYFRNNNELFSTCKTHATTAISITMDVKLGTRNSYSILKFDNKLREIMQNPDSLDTVPFWLQVIPRKADFKLSEGDGRNQALFNYILTLQSQGMSQEDIRTTIRIINNYILNEPMSSDELNVILRDEAFKKQSFFKESRFLHDVFALYLKQEYNIIRNDGNIMIYTEGVYEQSPRVIEKVMSKEIPSLKKMQRKEVLAQLDLICEDVPSGSSELIAFNNGVLNLNGMVMQNFTPQMVVTNKIPWDYNSEAYDELADKTLDRIACGDEQIRMLLEEMIGACFYRSNNLAGGKAFILTGDGANGKSTLLDALKVILGEKNYSALDLKNIADKFSTVRIYRKLANIGDDISDEFNADMSMFKKIVTGNTIEAQYKGQDVFEFTPYCKLIFSANSIPRIKDKTGAAQRRMVIIPFNATFSEDDPDYDPQIGRKLQSKSAIEYFIKLGIAGLKRVLESKHFTKSLKVQKELDDYAESNNPVLSFIKECDELDVNFRNESVQHVFQLYCEFCIKNGYHALANNEFSKQLQKHANLTTYRPYINNKRMSVYLERE